MKELSKKVSQDPLQTNRDLRASLTQLQVKLRNTTKGKRLIAICDTPEDMERAKELYRSSLKGTERKDVLMLFAEMLGRGLGFRNMSDQQAMLVKETYINTLMKFPEDAVTAVMRKSRADGWLPSVDKMVDEIERLISPRTDVLAALEGGLVDDIEKQKHRAKVFELAEDMQVRMSEMDGAEWKNLKGVFGSERAKLIKLVSDFNDAAKTSDHDRYKNILAEAKKYMERRFTPRLEESEEEKLSRSEKQRRRDYFLASTLSNLGVERREDFPPYSVVFGYRSDGTRLEVARTVTDEEAGNFIKGVERFKEKDKVNG